MKKSATSFARKDSAYKPEPTVLVVCEDLKSSRSYLKDVARYFRVQWDVEVTHCGSTDPKGIVEYAISNLRNYDEIYCVIDRDSHHNFDRALELAKAHPRITVIKSYPCFEFWLIIHFGYTCKPFNAAGKKSAGDRATEHLRAQEDMSDYNKGAKGLFAKLGEARLKDARTHSPRILAQSVTNNAPNPSTEIHILIDKMEVMSEPQPVKR